MRSVLLKILCGLATALLAVETANAESGRSVKTLHVTSLVDLGVTNPHVIRHQLAEPFLQPNRRGSLIEEHCRSVSTQARIRVSHIRLHSSEYRLKLFPRVVRMKDRALANSLGPFLGTFQSRAFPTITVVMLASVKAFPQRSDFVITSTNVAARDRPTRETGEDKIVAIPSEFADHFVNNPDGIVRRRIWISSSVRRDFP